MAAAVDATLTVGDRQRSIRAKLGFREADGTITPATLTAVTFKLVHALDNSVKVNYQPCVIEGPGVARYDLQAADVDTEATYYLWFRDIDGSGRPQHWPADGQTYVVKWVMAA